MTVEQLGSVGEFIGGVLVLITLVVLVYQLRQTQKAINSNSYLVSASLIYETFGDAANEFIATAMSNQLNGEELSNVQETALVNYWRGFIRRAEAFHYLNQQGLIDDDRLNQFGERMRNSARGVPTLVLAWEQDAETMLPIFREWGERYIYDEAGV